MQRNIAAFTETTETPPSFLSFNETSDGRVEVTARSRLKDGQHSADIVVVSVPVADMRRLADDLTLWASHSREDEI